MSVIATLSAEQALGNSSNSQPPPGDSMNSPAEPPPRLSADGGAGDGNATRFPLASRAAAARVAAAEARGEAARLVSALGADPELANGLVRRLGEVSRLVADLAAAAEE